MQRLRDKMREDLELRGMSANTISTYLRCARRFAEHFDRPPRAMGATEIRAFLLYLVKARRLCAATSNVYAAALKFLYAVTLGRPDAIAQMPRMRVPMHIPVVLTGGEIARLLAALRSEKLRALVMLAYGAGLRVSEACKLDIGDLDLHALQHKNWIVYAKRPFGGPEQVIRYLGRYTHRVGISNQRFVSMDERGVTFRTKEDKTITLSGKDFLARFVQHVLPHGFVKIRHYGLHAASNATTRLALARHLLAPATTPEGPPNRGHEMLDWRELLKRLSGVDARKCPQCHQLTLVRTALPIACSRAPPEAA